MALQDLTPQLRTRLRRVEKVVTAFVVLATLLLLGGFAYYLYHTAARKGWFIPKVPYYTYAMSAEGLNPGDTVMLMGRPVGTITKVDPQPPGSWYKIFVGFEVQRPHYGYIWTDSKVNIAAAGLFGARRLEIIAGYDGRPTVYETDKSRELLIDGKRVPAAAAPKGAFIPPVEDPALTERAQKLVLQIEQALPNILGLTNQVAATLNNVAAASSNAVQLTAQVNALLGDARPVLANINQISTNAVVITANLREPRGALGDWLLPTNLNAQISQTLTNVDNNLNQLTYQLGLTLINVANITSNLNQQVQTNDQILAEISRLVVDTDNLVQGLKKHWLLRGVFRAETAKTNSPPQERK